MKHTLKSLLIDVAALKKDNAALTRSVHTGESDEQHESALLVPEAGWCPEVMDAQAALESDNNTPAQAGSAPRNRSRASSCSSTVSAPDSDWSELQGVH